MQCVGFCLYDRTLCSALSHTLEFNYEQINSLETLPYLRFVVIP